MLKRNVNRKLEKRSALGIWKKVDDYKLMDVKEDCIKAIEDMLRSRENMQKIMKYVEENMPGWTISYYYKEGVHIVNIENKEILSKKRIVFEIE
jgi:hypothetical protein